MKEVLNQLKKITSGPDAAKLNCGTVLFAAVRLIPADILGLLSKVRTICSAQIFYQDYFKFAFNDLVTYLMEYLPIVGIL